MWLGQWIFVDKKKTKKKKQNGKEMKEFYFLTRNFNFHNCVYSFFYSGMGYNKTETRFPRTMLHFE